MNLDDFRTLCLAKKATVETQPFGPDVLVYKVVGKVFAITSFNEGDFSCSLKCNPERAIELREQHDWIVPGFHTNKKHWNTLTPISFRDDILLEELLDHSYNLVVNNMKKSEIEALNALK